MSIRGHHIVLRRWSPGKTDQDLCFRITTFWIQVHGLPLDHWTKDNAEKIGSLFDEMLDYDLAGEGPLNSNLNYMRLKVKLNIENPLASGFHLEDEYGGKKWVWFRYERLPNCCYNCGRLGHSKLVCPYETTGEVNRTQGKYGPTLKADEKAEIRATTVIVISLRVKGQILFIQMSIQRESSQKSLTQLISAMLDQGICIKGIIHQ